MLTVSGRKIGSLIVSMFGQLFLTTKFWLRAEKANSREDLVKKGLADGILPLNYENVSTWKRTQRELKGEVYPTKRELERTGGVI